MPSTQGVSLGTRGQVLEKESDSALIRLFKDQGGVEGLGIRLCGHVPAFPLAS